MRARSAGDRLRDEVADLAGHQRISDAPVGRLRHLGPTVRLSETAPYWARSSVLLGYNEPVWPTRAV